MNFDLLAKSKTNKFDLRGFFNNSKCVIEELKKNLQKSQKQILLVINCSQENFIKLILRNIHPESILIVFEGNSNVCKRIEKSGDFRVFVFNRSISEVYRIYRNCEIADGIISATPLFPISLNKLSQTIEISKSVLKPNGFYFHIAYFDVYRSRFKKIFPDSNFIKSIKIPFGAIYIGRND